MSRLTFDSHFMYFFVRYIVSSALLCCGGGAVAEDFSGLRDPTKPPRFQPNVPVQSATASVHRLASVIISPTRKVAVINGQVLAEGDQIDGASVLKIADGQVWLQLADNSHRTLSLHDTGSGHVSKSIRQPVARIEINPTTSVKERRDQSEFE